MNFNRRRLFKGILTLPVLSGLSTKAKATAESSQLRPGYYVAEHEALFVSERNLSTSNEPCYVQMFQPRRQKSYPVWTNLNVGTAPELQETLKGYKYYPSYRDFHAALLSGIFSDELSEALLPTPIWEQIRNRKRLT